MARFDTFDDDPRSPAKCRSAAAPRQPRTDLPCEHTVARLRTRLAAAAGIRIKDAMLLRRLGVPPFNGSSVLKLDAAGHVVSVGMTGREHAVCPIAVLEALEQRLGGV